MFELEVDLLLVGVEIRVVHEFVELFHVDGVISLIDKDVGILDLGFQLLHSLQHLLRVTTHVIDEGIVLTPKGLVRDVLWVELPHQVVVELVPLVWRVFSVLYVRYVVALLGSADVDDCSTKVVVIVLGRDVPL